MKKLVDEFIKQNLMDARQKVLYDLIKYEFPNIKNLKVEYSVNKNTLLVTFDTREGYTPQQVLDKVKEYKQFKR
jgi:hypothetical protein